MTDNLTDTYVASKALKAGFMLSSLHGKSELKLMPVSDIETLRQFAKEILNDR